MRPICWVTAVLVLSSACGSTVQVSGTRQLDGLSTGDGLSQVVAPAATAPAGTNQPALSPGSGPTSSRAPSAQGPTSESARGLPSVVTAGGQVVVGFLTYKDVAATGSALGIGGIATGDTENQMRTMAGSINARGGFLGHRIVLVSHDVKTAQSSSNPSQAAAEACADLVEKKASIVVNAGANAELLSCLKKHGVIVVGSTGITSSKEVFAPGLPGVYAPSAMSIDRYLPAFVDRLYAQGFFAKWDVRTGNPGIAPVRIGVQAFDNADGRRYVAVLGKALQKYGLRVDQTDLHPTDVASNASSTSSAVLRFNANGVTHLFNANVLFYKGADSQGYKPRYGVDDTIATPALLAQNVSKSQLHGAMGAGYLPAYEVPSAKDVSPAATRCKAMMKRAGEDISQPLALAFMLHVCDAMSFLEKGFQAGGAVTAAALESGLARLGSFESTITYRSTPTQAHHDGAAALRDYVYQDGCGCFAFVSTTTYPVP